MSPKGLWMTATMMLATLAIAAPSSTDEAPAVMALDAQYQAAVERNDAPTMAGILADDFELVTGAGRRFNKADLLEEARARRIVYEAQHASERTARVWGNTAVVTALLHAKGTENGKPFEYRVWYSDTYVRTAEGWRYVFGQSSLPLPPRASLQR